MYFFKSRADNSDMLTWYFFANINFCFFISQQGCWLCVHKAFLIKQNVLVLVWFWVCLQLKDLFSETDQKRKGMFVFTDLVCERLYRTFLQSPFSWNFPSQLVFLEFILGSPDTMFMSSEQRSANSESFLCYHKSSPLASVLYLPFFVHNLAALSPSPRDKWHHCYNENSKQHHWI